MNALHQDFASRADSSFGPDALRWANQFYTTFATRNLPLMRAAYHPRATFYDPLFGKLVGVEQIMLMWSEIMPAADPFRILPRPAHSATLRSDGSWRVQVAWEAYYGLGKARIANFSQTTLVFRDGKIIDQRDEWDLQRWVIQVLPHTPTGPWQVRIAARVANFAAHGYVEALDFIRMLRTLKP